MEYKRLRNEAVSRIRKDQKDYRTGILKSFKGNPKKFFGYIRNKMTVKEQVTQLKKPDGDMTGDDAEAADVLATYFGSVLWTKLS